jgi:hypothetical protein
MKSRATCFDLVIITHILRYKNVKFYTYKMSSVNYLLVHNNDIPHSVWVCNLKCWAVCLTPYAYIGKKCWKADFLLHSQKTAACVPLLDSLGTTDFGCSSDKALHLLQLTKFIWFSESTNSNGFLFFFLTLWMNKTNYSRWLACRNLDQSQRNMIRRCRMN